MSIALLPGRNSFDALLDRLGESDMTQTEDDLLRDSHWLLGQDARLREDFRFRQTPWGRWMCGKDLLANDFLYRDLHAGGERGAELRSSLQAIEREVGCHSVFCPDDPRFVLHGGEVRLAASERSQVWPIENEIIEVEKFTTHLPIYKLREVAASDRYDEPGNGAPSHMIETNGWIRVPDLNDLDPKMFVARIEGSSMDDGRSGFVDGGFAVFELWPTGSVNGSYVLVRGMFDDPDMGNCSVRRLVAREPGVHSHGNKRHAGSVTLVALNPDKERYPDIEIPPQHCGDLKITAKMIEPLSLGDHYEQSTSFRRRGRRDLESETALGDVRRRLETKAAQFFHSESNEIAEDESPNSNAWNSQAVCLDAEAGGLHLEIGPLVGLWKFVKVLVARASSGETRKTLAYNARLRPVRVAVLPSDGGWRWGAEDFEDDPDLDLSELDVPGVPSDRPSAFRVMADGIGRAMKGRNLSPGQVYRLLVPPGNLESSELSFAMTLVVDGWRIIELAIPYDPDPKLVRDLESLGFRIGYPEPSLEFGLASWPDEWRSTVRGESYATFAPSRDEFGSVFISARGYDADIDDEATLFVCGPSGTRHIRLPAGDAAVVELAGLCIGQYYCSLLHRRTQLVPADLPFEISANLAAPPRASVGAAVAGRVADGVPDEETRVWRGDLALVKEDAIVIEGPPGLRARVFWREVLDDYLDCLEFDLSGHLDVSSLMELVGERRDRQALADLVLEFGEFGTIVFEHERRSSPEDLGASLRKFLTKGRRESIRRHSGEFLQSHSTWFIPVGRHLGYEVGPLEEFRDSPPTHAAVTKLMVTERLGGGISKRCKRILVIVEELKPVLDEENFAWLDRQCEQHSVDSAIVSNGLDWAVHRSKSRLPFRIWNLDEVLGESRDFLDFLRDIAEGV